MSTPIILFLELYYYIRILEAFMEQLICERIANRRKELNLSGADISRLTGISPGNLNSIEHGKVLPSATALMGLSKALNCTTDWILFGSEANSYKNNDKNINNYPKLNNANDVTNLSDDAMRMLELFYMLPENERQELIFVANLKLRKLKKDSAEKLSTSENKSGETNIA